MCQTKSVPEHHVFVFEIRVGVLGDPRGDALGRFAGCLRDVAAGGVDLGVGVWVDFLLELAGCGGGGG